MNKIHCDHCDKVIEIFLNYEYVKFVGTWHGKAMDGIWCDGDCFIEWMKENEYNCVPRPYQPIPH